MCVLTPFHLNVVTMLCLGSSLKIWLGLGKDLVLGLGLVRLGSVITNTAGNCLFKNSQPDIVCPKVYPYSLKSGLLLKISSDDILTNVEMLVMLVA